MFLKYICRICVVTIIICSGSGVMHAYGESTVTIGIQDTSTFFDPAKVRESFTRAMHKQLYETLVSFAGDDFTNPIPQLAESWAVSDDGKTWTFHLRKGVHFSSGNLVDADAVIYSLHRVLRLGGQSVWLLTQFGITEESISKIDDATVQIVMSEPFAPNLVLACLANSAISIVDRLLLVEHGQDGDMGSAWLDSNSAGSGRFVLEERIKGDVFTMKANKNHWQNPPITDIVKVRNIPEPFDQALALKNGEIDIAWNLSPDQINRLEEDPDIQIYTSPTLRIRFVGMNLGYAPLAHSEVRDAIRYAIDYDGIMDFILQGAGTKIQSFIPEGVFAANLSTPYSPDSAKAKELLAQAGYPDGFEVELATQNYSPWSDIALQIKHDLQQIGLTVTLNEKKDLGELVNYIFTRETQLFLAQWEIDYIDPDGMAKPFAHSDSLGDDATVKLIAWLAHYLNPELARLIEQATREVDIEKRAHMYQEITGTILDDGPYAILHSPSIEYGVRLEKRDLIGIPSPYLTSFPKIN